MSPSGTRGSLPELVLVNVQDQDIAEELLGDLDGSLHRLVRVVRTIDGDQDVLEHVNLASRLV